MRPLWIAVAAILAGSALPASAALDKVGLAELDRAAALMRNSPAMRLPNTRIIPHWAADGASFWYRRDTPAGRDYRRVEAAAGAANAAFDHKAVAAALAGAGAQATPDTLDIAAITSEAVEPVVDGRRYRCLVGGPVCTALSGPDPTAIPSPDGLSAVFRRSGNLWVRDLAKGTERPLTTDGEAQFGYGMPSDRYDQDKLVRDRAGVILPPVQTWWSPDGRRLVTARLDQRHIAPYPYLENAPRDGSFRPQVREVRLPLMGEAPGILDWWVIDVATGDKRRIDFPADRMIAANNGIDDLKIAWGHDGSLLAISGMTDFVGAEAFAVDLATGRVRLVVQDTSTPGNPLVAGGYGRPVSRFIRGGRELLWWSERDGWGHLYRYEVRSGRLLGRVTRGNWLVRDIVAVDEARGQLWFTGMGREPGNPYHRYLYRVGLNGRGLTLMSPERGDHMIIDPTGSALVFDGAGPTEVVAPDFRHYVYDVSSVTEPMRTILRRADDRAAVATVEHSDASRLLGAGYQPPEEALVTTADGRNLHGLVYRPPGYDRTRRYPVIDVEYGNPAVAITPRTFHRAAIFSGTAATPAALAELGFVVVVVDARGTPYRSRAFSHPHVGYLKTMGLNDHIAFIQGIAARDPGLDLGRVGIVGQSFGGYTVLRALIEFPDFFKVGVAASPQTAYHNMAAEAVLTASQGPPVYADGSATRPTPTAIPENFRDLDAAAGLDRITGHLLVFAGEQDENVYPGSIAQFMERAIRENRNVDWVWLPNTGHDGLFTPYALRRSIEFLTRHLQDRLLPDTLPPLPSPRR